MFTDEFTTSQTKLNIKQTIKDISSLKYCYERLFDVFVLRTFITSHLLKRITQNNIETIVLKNKFKLKIELIMKTHTNIVVKYRLEIYANCD